LVLSMDHCGPCQGGLRVSKPFLCNAILELGTDTAAPRDSLATGDHTALPKVLCESSIVGMVVQQALNCLLPCRVSSAPVDS